MIGKRNYIKRGTINLTNDNLSDLYSIISKFEKHIELTHNECGLLVHLCSFDIGISQADYVRKLCYHIRNSDSIPEEEKANILPAMYLNIARFIDDEFEQEKLLEEVNMLKYCENALDRKIRLAKDNEISLIIWIFSKEKSIR